MKIKCDDETHLIIFQRSNTLSPLHLQRLIPQKKFNILGVKIPCYSFLDCIFIEKSSSMQNFFKVSEEKVVTGRQILTVGRMVKLYEATFPYSSPRCA